MSLLVRLFLSYLRLSGVLLSCRLALSPHVFPPLVSSGLLHSGLVPAASGSLLGASWVRVRASAVRKPCKLRGLGASTPQNRGLAAVFT